MIIKAEKLTREHVKCNVTGLVAELIQYDSELGWDIMHGDPESGQLA